MIATGKKLRNDNYPLISRLTVKSLESKKKTQLQLDYHEPRYCYSEMSYYNRRIYFLKA